MSRLTPASGPKGTAFVLTHESDPNRRDKATSIIALAITRSLGRHHIPVVRIHPNRLDYSLHSKYCSHVAICPDMYESEAALVDYLRELASGYERPRVLFPASDDCAYFLGKARSQLTDLYEMCVASSGVMEIAVNKERQYGEAVRLGIPIPETYFPKTVADVEQLKARLQHYPYVIKPLMAHTWRLASMRQVSEGKKAITVHSFDEVSTRYRQLGDHGREVMLQEIIGGKDELLYTFLGCVGMGRQPLGYCVRHKVRQLPLDFGYCTMTISCRNDVIVEQSLSLLKGIDYTGLCGVEYKLDRDTQEYKLLEINPRAVNTMGLAPACGVDLPYLAFRDAVGAPVQPVTSWQEGVKWFWLEADFWAARELRRRGHFSLWDWQGSLRGRRTEAIYAKDDRKPGVLHYRRVIWCALRSKLAKTIRPS